MTLTKLSIMLASIIAGVIGCLVLRGAAMASEQSTPADERTASA